MTSENVPPLRIREEDGNPNSIPVYDIIVSNGTLTQVGPGIVRLATGAGAGGSITVPLIVSSGGTGQVSHTENGILYGTGANAIEALSALNSGQLVVGSAPSAAPQILGAGSQGQILVSDSSVRLGLAWINSSSVQGAAGIVYAQTGDTFLVYAASTSLTGERIIAGSDNITIVSSGTSFLISANTGALNTAGSGLALTGSTLTVNTNIRDKSFGYFFAGSLSTVMMAQSAMIYIPFNMQIQDIRSSVSNSPVGQNIRIQPTQFNASLTAGTGMFQVADKPFVFTNNLIGSHNGAANFGFGGTLYAGSWLACNLDAIGTTNPGSNLTINFMVRTS